MESKGNSKAGLSKTSFKAGLACERRLWLDRNAPEAADERFCDKSTEMGTEVGALARGYYRGTELADVWPADDPARLRMAAERTAELLKERACGCIAEATFFHGGHKCQVDLLRRRPYDGFALIEVKSACNVWRDKAKTRVREDYIADIAFQAWLLRKAGVRLAKLMLMHPDAAYRLEGELDVKSYFALEDVTDEAWEVAESLVEPNVARLSAAASLAEEPSSEPGGRCCSPKCPYLGRCLPQTNDPRSIVWAGGMSRKKAISLIASGVETMSDYLEMEDAEAARAAASGKSRRPMGEALRTQLAGVPKVDKGRLGEWLSPMEGRDLCWLDFETWQLPVPRFRGDKPWEQVPVQYSLHVTSPDGRVAHREFLANAGDDPWGEIAERLASDIPAGAVTVAYNKSFERDRIRSMAAKRPDLADRLLGIIGEGDAPDGALVDLIDPFKKGWVYTPAMGGSKSIKVTLPAMFPGDEGLDYHNLATCADGAPSVQNGTMAMEAFAAMEDMADGRMVAATRENLLRYCELDTWAMVKIWLRLRELAGLDPLPALPVESLLPRPCAGAL